MWTNVEGVEITSYAQVVQMAEADMDSSVGNGACCVPVEDDEAAVTIGISNISQSQPEQQAVYIEPYKKQHQKIVIHNVYPNPAMEKVNFSMTSIVDEAIDYVIYSSQGQAMGQGQLSEGQGIKLLQLNLEDYAPGIYFVRFNTNTYHHPVRFVKQ